MIILLTKIFYFYWMKKVFFYFFIRQGNLENSTWSFLWWWWRLKNDWSESFIKNILQTFTGQSGTFHVFQTIFDWFCFLSSLFDRNWSFIQFCKILEGFLIASQIDLGPNKNAIDSRAMMFQFGHPFFGDVIKRGMFDNREANKKDISFWVGQCSDSRVTFLSS